MLGYGSKDWRSPGELWVKNGGGWERFKVLRFSGNESSPGQEAEPIQPHCRINRRQTREISACNTLSEALQLLDFQNALRDQRKFHYICVIIRLLISNPLLGGNSQRQLVKLLFQICDQVRYGWRVDLLRIIIQEMRKSLDSTFWGGNLGSAQLWTENKDKIDKIEDLMALYSEEAPKIPIHDLPDEIKRLIILKLSNDKDLKNLAEADDALKVILSENRVIWKKLCIYHFSRENIINSIVRLQEQQQNNNNSNPNKTFCQNHKLDSSSNLNANSNSGCNLNSNSKFNGECGESNESREDHNHLRNGNNNNNRGDDDSKENLDWENIYRHLKRKFNLKEEYAESLIFCKPCNVLFWPSFGHPECRSESMYFDKEGKDESNFLFEVKPSDFISFFST